ncbi:MAG: hypothetical protein ACP5HG_14195 [Anaerolineae bacterium]
MIRRGRWLSVCLALIGAATLIGMTLSGCDTVASLRTPQAPETPDAISQWAIDATASSHYALPDWSPRRATGSPEVGRCADDARAWSSARGNGVEWLELTYGTPVHAVEVRIHQTYGRGAVSRVSLIDTEGETWMVWEGEDRAAPCPGVLTVPVLQTPYQVVGVRIDLDESRTGTWNQIDAVELLGVP